LRILSGDLMIRSGEFAISLDRRESGSHLDFISHAHSDHVAAAKKSEYPLASSETLELMREAYGYNVDKCKMHQGRDVPKFSMIDAGHMLGSKQLVVDTDLYGRVVYTGDFQMQKSRVAKPIEIKSCDTVIIDSTYPNSGVKFDPREEVEYAMQKWTSKKLEYGIVLFSAYAMGKAQEIIAILNEAGISPLVSDKISRISEVYKSYGMGLDYTRIAPDLADQGNFAMITEKPLALTASNLSASYGRRVFTAVATGFAKSVVFNTDVQFPISDHADFFQSLEYISGSGAKKVLTYGKQSDIFAENLRKEGIDADPFPKQVG
jgi:putative mRNA 3-end processing factor